MAIVTLSNELVSLPYILTNLSPSQNKSPCIRAKTKFLTTAGTWTKELVSMTVFVNGEVKNHDQKSNVSLMLSHVAPTLRRSKAAFAVEFTPFLRIRYEYVAIGHAPGSSAPIKSAVSLVDSSSLFPNCNPLCKIANVIELESGRTGLFMLAILSKSPIVLNCKFIASDNTTYPIEYSFPFTKLARPYPVSSSFKTLLAICAPHEGNFDAPMLSLNVLEK